MQIVGAGAERVAHPSDTAEVAVAFDRNGRVTTSQLRKSSGSERTDAAAVDAAVELATLRQPADVAGRTLLFRARFDSAPLG